MIKLKTQLEALETNLTPEVLSEPKWMSSKALGKN